MSRRFEMPPPGLFPRLVPFLVGGLLPLVLIGVVALTAPAGRVPWRDILPSLLALPVVGLLIAVNLQGRVVEIVGDRLRVRRWPVPRSFPIASLDLEAARVSDFEREPALRPAIKLVGARMPGLRSGWFMLKDRRSAYMLTGSGSRFAVLPMAGKRLLVLGVERPEALLDALRDGARPRR